MEILQLAQKARYAAAQLSVAPVQQRNAVLMSCAQKLEQKVSSILAANAIDVQNAMAEGLSAPMVSRLTLTEAKCVRMAEGLRSLARLPDPLGQVQYAKELCEGMSLYRVSCPIGVIGVIFESRPDALIQISSLCLKSGNAALLKGGREALHSNEALVRIMRDASVECGLPAEWCGLLHSREDVQQMLKLDEWIDLIIPRGSNAFVRYIMQNSSIPVLGHAEGLCHVYVDSPCDVHEAVRVAVDSKAQNLSVCNAAETLLVHQDVAEVFLPLIKTELEARRIELRGDEATRRIISCKLASDEDWRTEYLDAILSIKVVRSEEEAIAHINRFGSHHTDVILSTDKGHIHDFMTRVDSADVFANCSTRFSDGFLFGFGAEVGIATGKLHARGPMGVEGLCTYKYRLYGQGQTLAQLNAGELRLTHAAIDPKLPD